MMRAYGISAIIVSLAGASLSSAQSPAPPAFKHRAVVQPGGVAPEVVSQHGAVVERALLIRDVAVVNRPDFNLPNGSWSFAAVIGRAFQRVGAGMPNAQSLTDQLRGTIASSMPLPGGILYQEWRKQSPEFTLTQAPVHLLAIVNRVDLAQYDPAGCKADGQPGEMRGTEVLFVYAGLPSPTHFHYLSMIVEFVLPCLSKSDFKSLAQDWLPLVSLDWTPAAAAYQHKLEDILTHETRRRTRGTPASSCSQTAGFARAISSVNRTSRSASVRALQRRWANSPLAMSAAFSRRITSSTTGVCWIAATHSVRSTRCSRSAKTQPPASTTTTSDSRCH